MKATYKLLDENNKVLLESDSPIDIFIAGVAYQEYNVPVKDIPTLVEIAVDCYLKTDEIPLEPFADFVAENYKKVLKIYNEQGRWAVLELYWESEI